MAALKALPPAVRALLRNPILVVLVGLLALVQVPQLAVQPTQPLLAALVSLATTAVMILVLPFVLGGLIAMANEALDGTTGLDTLLSAGKTNYVPLLFAYLTLFVANFVLGFVTVLVVVVGGIGIFYGSGQPSALAWGIVAVVLVLAVLAYLLVAFFLQFYPHAIVLGDTGFLESFKRSAGLVRSNLVSVLGYSLVVFAGSLVFGGVGAVASLVLSPRPLPGLALPEFSLPVIVASAIGYVLVLAVVGAFYLVYSVSFYRRIAPQSAQA